MNEQIKKIRAEIERRITMLRIGCKHSEANELLPILSFIDSLQDEPNTEETELNSIAFLEQLGYTCIPPKKSWPPQDNTPTYASTEYKVSKELITNPNMDSSDAKCGKLEKSEIPTNLEQEVYNYCYDNFVYDNDEDGWYSTDKLATIIREDMIELARHFAEWGRNHLTINSLSEELIDASNDYTLNIRKGYPRVKDETDRYISNAFIDGAEWQKKKDELEFCYEEAFDNGVKYTKEQMIKEAVEGSVIVAYIAPSGEQYGNIVSTDVEIDRFSLNEGDKVKLIIIPQDDE